jgi:hypothetical protein
VKLVTFLNYILDMDKLYEVYTKVIKVFTMLLVKGQNKLECLSLAKPFQLSILFGSRVGAYPSEECPFTHFIWASTNFTKSMSKLL